MNRMSINPFGSFEPLTDAQLKTNIRVVLLVLAPLLVLVLAIIAAVSTGIVWIAAGCAVLCLVAWIIIAGQRNMQYTPRFGPLYNFYRIIIGGVTFYSGVAWRGLRGIYNRLHFDHGLSISPAIFALIILIFSLVWLTLTNLALYRTEDKLKADLLGCVELLPLVLACGAIMFLILYA